MVPGAVGELLLARAVGLSREDVGAAVSRPDAERDPAVVLSGVGRRDRREDETGECRPEPDRQQE